MGTDSSNPDQILWSNELQRMILQQIQREADSRPGKRGLIQTGLDLGDLFPPDRDLALVCERPFIALVSGHRDSGKSACIFRVQQLLRHQADPYAVGLPPDAVKYLPDYYGLVSSFEELPRGCVAYIPEAYRTFHARGSGRTQGLLIGDLVNLSRHRDQSLILEVQNPAQLDRNIISEADMILIKEPAPLSQGFERPQFRKYMDEARGLFSAMKKARRKRAVYVVAPGQGIGGKIMENRLPTFWSGALSKVFSSSRPGVPNHELLSRKSRGRRSTDAVAERKATARKMKKAGFSFLEIAEALGVSKTQASRYCNE